MRRKRPSEARHVIPLVMRESTNLRVVLFGAFVMLAGIVMLGSMFDAVAETGIWRSLPIVFYTSVALCGGTYFLVLVALQSLFMPERLILTETDLTAYVRRRRHRAGWSQIADIVAHDVPLMNRDSGNMPRVTIRLHTPSGAPVIWIEILDGYQIGHHAIAEELRRWHAEAVKRHVGPPDLSLAKAVIAQRDHLLIRIAVAALVLPLLLGALMWLTAER